MAEFLCIYLTRVPIQQEANQLVTFVKEIHQPLSLLTLKDSRQAIQALKKFLALQQETDLSLLHQEHSPRQFAAQRHQLALHERDLRVQLKIPEITVDVESDPKKVSSVSLKLGQLKKHDDLIIAGKLLSVTTCRMECQTVAEFRNRVIGHNIKLVEATKNPDGHVTSYSSSDKLKIIHTLHSKQISVSELRNV